MSRWQVRSLTLLLLVCPEMGACSNGEGDKADGGLQSDGAQAAVGTLPDISTFLTNKSERFIVDADAVEGGHPYKGVNSVMPHQGAHVLFDNSGNKWPKGGTAPANYPPIYAAADGTVAHIEEYLQAGSNYRYGFSLAFASTGGAAINLDYSVEPFVNPNDSAFYKPYIVAKQGQPVKKGDVLAYMYLAPGSAQGAHIHYHLMNTANAQFMAPAIFTEGVVQAVAARWGGFGMDGTTQMPPCMGYQLGAAENPFGTGAVSAL